MQEFDESSISMDLTSRSCVSIGHQFQSTRPETSIAELYRSEKNRTEREYERYLGQTKNRVNEGQMLNESKNV
jgi:hypothetical protein